MRKAECYCGREVVFDATAGKWVHWVEPTPNGHAASPLISKQVQCPKCDHPFVVFVERPAPPPIEEGAAA